MRQRVLPPSPNNAADEGIVSENEFLAAFGITDPPAADPATDPSAADPEPDPAKELEPDPAKDSDPEPSKDPEPEKPDKAQQQAHVFAELRTKNANYEKMLKGIADVLQIQVDPNNPEAVTDAVNKKILEAQAAKTGVPVELLDKVNKLEEKDKMNTLAQIRQNAYLGFQAVKDTFKLDNKNLEAFADELRAHGLNPFEQSLDLVAEYQTRHFNDLMKAAEERGAQQEAERAANANEHSSSPDKKQGKGETDTEKITTVSQLSDWLNSQEK